MLFLVAASSYLQRDVKNITGRGHRFAGRRIRPRVIQSSIMSTISIDAAKNLFNY